MTSLFLSFSDKTRIKREENHIIHNGSENYDSCIIDFEMKKVFIYIDNNNSDNNIIFLLIYGVFHMFIIIILYLCFILLCLILFRAFEIGNKCADICLFIILLLSICKYYKVLD